MVMDLAKVVMRIDVSINGENKCGCGQLSNIWKKIFLVLPINYIYD